ncbi:MAG: peptide chain release factor N(5)-glutamine methyltransferase [Burkholderiales bacterium]|nr:peptide chain release factor N(5)-glutamine methyltransferase [Burkholderiales bacterium]
MTKIRELANTSELSKLDTRILLSLVTGFSHAQLISRDDHIMNDIQLSLYNTYYDRAKSGEPIAYIVGNKEFFGYDFTVNSHTLIPRPETEHLVEEVINLAPLNGNVLDLGTGSGCIAISCKLERPDLNITAIDNYNETLAVARQNSINLKAKINFLRSNWFENTSEKFDIIVSNPPYIEKNDIHMAKLQHEPINALTDHLDGFSCIDHIAKNCVKHMNNGAYIIIEHGYNQGNTVRQLLLDAGLHNIISKLDYAKLERYTMACYRI